MSDNQPDTTAQALQARVHAIEAEIQTHTHRINVLTEIRDELLEIITATSRRPRSPRKGRTVDPNVLDLTIPRTTEVEPPPPDDAA